MRVATCPYLLLMAPIALMALDAPAQPAENLLANADLGRGAYSPSGWSFNTSAGNVVTWQTSADGARRAVLLEGSGRDWAGLTSARFAVTPGERLTVGALLSALPDRPGEARDRLFVRFFQAGRFVGQDGPGLGGVGAAWQVVSGTVTVPEGADAADVSLQIRSRAAVRVAGVCCLPGEAQAAVSDCLPSVPGETAWADVRPEDMLPRDADGNGLPDVLERFLGIRPEDGAASIRRTRPKTTSLQTPGPYREDNDLKVDIVIVAGNAERDIQSWAAFGYEPHVMVGFRAGPDYLQQRHGDLLGRHEVQTTADGTLLTCGPHSYYMVPTANRREIFRQYFADAVARGARAACPEEPEFFAQAGYSEAFKREWAAHYGEPWRDQGLSVENRFLSDRLKVVLERRLLEACWEGARSVDPTVPRFLLTHSPLNYTGWGIVFGIHDAIASGQVDAMIAQVWTGTARTPVRYEGRRAERTFENAWLEYASCLGVTRGTDVEMWFLMDPLEDNPDRSMEDYLFNYRRTLAAALMFPEVTRYETMPWPTRIFGRVPDDFATVIGSVISLLSDMHAQTDIEADMGTPGIGTFLSDSAMWQRGAPHQSDMDCFYGLALPLLMRGIPVEVPSLDRAAEPGYLDAYRVLLVSYDMLKPMSPRINEALADWTRRGGCLVFLGGDDPYNEVPQWWREQGFNAPGDHLLSLCGVDASLRRVVPGALHDLQWRQVATTSYAGHEVDLSRQSTQRIDLTPFLEHGVALVRCEDSIKHDGFGALITRIVARGVRDGRPVRMDIRPDTPQEREIIVHEHGTGLNREHGYRFCDRYAQVVYRFDFDAGSRATLELEIGNQYLVSAAAGRRRLDGNFRAVTEPGALGVPAVALEPDLSLVTGDDPALTPLYSGPRGVLLAEMPAGRGHVLVWSASPAWFARSAEGARQLRGLTRYAVEDKLGLEWREQGHLKLQRGPYVVARTLDEPLALEGRFIDLLSPTLEVMQDPVLPPDDMAVLRRFPPGNVEPAVAHSSSCVEWRQESEAGVRMILSGARGTVGVTRVQTGERRLTGIRALNVRGEAPEIEALPGPDSLLLRYPNEPFGLAVQVLLGGG